MTASVIDQHRKPFMPCSPRKVQKLLPAQKIHIISRQPFSIQWRSVIREGKQFFAIGMDLSVKHIGMTMASDTRMPAKGEMLWLDDLPTPLTMRRLRRSRHYRKTHHPRPKCRYQTRRAYNPWNKRWAKIPHSASSRQPESWFPPRPGTHVENPFWWIVNFMTFLPNPNFSHGPATFDGQKMIRPVNQPREYQQDQAFGTYAVGPFVLARERYPWRVCLQHSNEMGPDCRANYFASGLPVFTLSLFRHVSPHLLVQATAFDSQACCDWVQTIIQQDTRESPEHEAWLSFLYSQYSQHNTTLVRNRYQGSGLKHRRPRIHGPPPPRCLISQSSNIPGISGSHCTPATNPGEYFEFMGVYHVHRVGRTYCRRYGSGERNRPGRSTAPGPRRGACRRR